MRYFILMISTLAWFQLTKGQCDSQDSSISIIKCDGFERRGEVLYIDFYKISKPCSCEVNPLFEGSLLINTREISISPCSTEVTIGMEMIFNCPTKDAGISLDVNDTSSIEVISRYQANKSPGEFYHCVRVQENSADAIAGGILVCLVLIILAVICSRSQTLKAQRQASNITIDSYIVPFCNQQGNDEQCLAEFDNSFDAIQVDDRPNTPNMPPAGLAGHDVKGEVNVLHINTAQAAVL